jgi:GrpB-like predicted nucleotidyltransferase (UPF0157 family)
LKLLAELQTLLPNQRRRPGESLLPHCPTLHSGRLLSTIMPTGRVGRKGEMDGTPTIEITVYDERWPRIFELERVPIAEALGITLDRIHHVGSTAVSGLSAKPIVDIQAEVENLLTRARYDQLLERFGYESIDSGENDLRVAMRKRSSIAANLHVVVAGSWTAERTKLFRDALREDEELVERYARLKRDRAASESDLEAYTLAKTDFVEDVIEERARFLGIRYSRGNRR